MYQTLLVPVDGSDGSFAAVDVALAVAAANDAAVHALYVVDERFYADEYDLVVERVEAEGEAALDRVGRAGAAAGRPVEKHLRRGVPHEEILAAVEAYDADLVVMGTNGRTGLERLVHLGSVTERVVRASPVQVLTVPVSGATE